MTALLVALAGLPGSGKTTVARLLARELGAVHVRIDVIETALETSGAVSLVEHPALGYRVAYFEAIEHLRSGRGVIADSVNPIAVTREAWRWVASEGAARIVEVEVVCSDAAEHRRRVEARIADIPGHVEPTWAEVLSREYEPLELGPAAFRIDTARDFTEALVQVVVRIRASADT
jgi:predicted kinase